MMIFVMYLYYVYEYIGLKSVIIINKTKIISDNLVHQVGAVMAHSYARKLYTTIT